jgi:hypothetical protein
MLRIILISCICALLASCVSTPYEEEYTTYSSEHFTVLYLESEFSLQEVERISIKKERFLAYAIEAMHLPYGGRIDAYLYLRGEEFAFANINEETYESRAYVMTDPGHEIVHIVCFEGLGYSRSGFLKEGIATAFELDLNHYNAIEAFVDYTTYHSLIYKTDTGWVLRKPSIADQISNDKFDYDYYSYKQAGAFVQYLIEQFGVDKMKQFYSSTVKTSASLREKDFRDIFGASIAAVEKKFLNAYFPNSQ